MRIKVLPLETYMRYWRGELGAKEVKVEIGRDGYYYSRLDNKAWFEVGGIAYERDPKDFKYRLRLLNHTPLRPKEVQAFRLLALEHLTSKQQQALMYLDECWKQIRATGRNARVWMMKSGIRKKKE